MKPRTGALVSCLAAALAIPSCITRPPSNPDDLCRVFREKHRWYRAAHASAQRWGVPEPVQMAVLFQESSFRATARPPRKRHLGVFPGRRASSAYGYGQVINGTWERYRASSGRPDARRDDFDDVADFLGWYGAELHRRTGISRADAYAFYLAYHEGPGGFARGSHEKKPRLRKVARRVAARADRYAGQYAGCREQLREDRRWWRF